MNQIKALDLFCCAGGASMGLNQAGMDVTGVSFVEEPEYPFKLIVEYAEKLDIEFIKQFDFVWASPPCQLYSWSAKRWTNIQRVDLVDPIRQILLKTGLPFVIENVLEAPIRRDLVLCGEMFGLKVIRHRAFECHGFKPEQPKHIKHKGTVKEGCYVTVAGHGGDGKASLRSWQEGMGINWIKNKKSLAEAVPPAYAKYIAEEFLKTLK